MSDGGSPCWALCHLNATEEAARRVSSCSSRSTLWTKPFSCIHHPCPPDCFAVCPVLSEIRLAQHPFFWQFWFWPLEATYPRTSVYMYSELAHRLLALATRTVDPWIRHNTICWLINNSILSVCKHVWIQSHPHLPPSLLLTKCVLCPWARFSLCLWFYYVLIGFALVSSQTAVALVRCWYTWTHMGCRPLWITMSELLLLLYACDLSLNSWGIVCLRVWGHPWSLSLQAARRIKGMDLIRRNRACREVNG